jgi:integrase
MKWCIAKGWRKDDPTQSIVQALPKHDRRQVAHRKAVAYGEVATCLAAVQASGALLATKLALEFLVLTAARSGEVRLARWTEIDAGKAVWTVPAKRMKAGREHRVPLSGQALKVLERARVLYDGSGLIFPSAREGRPLSDMTLSKLIKELGFAADVHGFRTSFRMWTQEATGYPREIAEFALAHVTRDKVEAAYARSDLFERRRTLMEDWADFLQSGKREARFG